MSSVFPLRTARHACLLLAAMAAIPAVLRPAPAVADDIIVVKADESLGAPRLRQGFLHGITYRPGADYSNTVALVTALKPKSWRLANHDNNVYGFVVGEAKLPQTVGTEIVFNIQDAFNVTYGYNVQVSPDCAPTASACFSSYEAFKEAWAGVVHGVMTAVAQHEGVVHWFEVFAEPTHGATKLAGLSHEQLADTFKITHDIARQHRPDAKIVAPSLVGFSPSALKSFLTFVADNDLRLDALNWHEFRHPNLVGPNVYEMREFFKTQPKLCTPTCPEIHIGEYAPYAQSFIPGYAVGWLYHLERAGADQANRGCWDLPGGGTSCWATFNGMLSLDNATPLSLYWVYKAYADLHGVRVSTESSQQRTVALASKDEAKSEIRILVGKYAANTPPPAHTVIQVKGFPGDAAWVNAEIRRIPDTGNELQPMPAEPAAEIQAMPVLDKGFSIVIDEFRNGEAYIIVVRPSGP